MNKREKTLAIGVGALVVLLVIYYLFDSVASKFTDRDRQLADLNQKIQQKQEKLNAGLRAQKQIVEWNRRSLPSDAKQAPLALSKLAAETCRRCQARLRHGATTIDRRTRRHLRKVRLPNQGPIPMCR